MAALCGCGLEKNGLLDNVDATPDVSLGQDAAADQAAPSEDAPAGMDARDVEARAIDAVADVTLDTPADARLDAPFDVADAVVEAGADSPAGLPDAKPDALADAMTDAPSNGGPSPIVWDGGVIADPQPVDSDWVLFCASLNACGDFTSLSQCGSLLAQPTSPDALIPPMDLVRRVNQAAPDCAAMHALLGDGTACVSTTPDTCSGNSLVTCRWSLKMTVNCGSLGMVCSRGNGNAGCGFGDCAPGQEGSKYCVGGNHVVQCKNGRYTPILDCATFGTTCVNVANGGAQCQGTGSRCFASTCNSSSFVDECFGGLRASVDCSVLYSEPRYRCLTSNAGAPYCGIGSKCDPTTHPDTCRGRSLIDYCHAGVPDVFDCSASAVYTQCLAGSCI